MAPVRPADVAGTRTLAVSRAIAVVSGGLVVVGLLGPDRGAGNTAAELADWALAIAGPLLGVRMVAYAPRNVVGWLFLGFGALSAVSVAAAAWAAVPVLCWVRAWSWWPPRLLFLPLMALLFPTGSPLSKRWRPLVWVTVVGGAVSTAGIAVAAFAEPCAFMDKVLTGDPTLSSPGLPVAAVGVVLVTAAVLPAVVSMALRIARETGRQRRILWWTFGAVLLLMVVMVADAVSEHGFPGGWLVAAFVLPAAVFVAIAWYGLYDIDLVVHRALLYGTLTLALLAIFAGVVAAAGHVPGGHSYNIVAAAIVAVVALPLYTRLRAAADRLVYGERHDAYATMSRLGLLLEGNLAPADVLPVVVGTIGAALKVPYVAICWPGNPEPAAEYGTPGNRAHVSLPLTYRGETVGELRVGTRSPEEGFTRAELAALSDLARNAGAAAHALRLNLDLQHARERLVIGREEERRRLRRDLHDGVGPTLAGMAMQLGVARTLLRTGEVARTGELLATVESELVECTAEVRRVVHGLRPPALDERGLVAAIEAQAARLTGEAPTSPEVRLDVIEEQLTGLPAAVEVAALRISVEAITNTVRHAGASTCRVRMRRTPGRLVIQVSDDGVGLDPATASGVGTSAMRERAAELGGSCSATPRARGGTLVLVALPITTPGPPP
ncbi:sensor histidine kinase [Luedemannella flava]|uniref:sensor histidine kinase n=1 Tax=Luedemannella flava TaxID=349316 RepID=UPI0031D62E7E